MVFNIGASAPMTILNYSGPWGTHPTDPTVNPLPRNTDLIFGMDEMPTIYFYSTGTLTVKSSFGKFDICCWGGGSAGEAVTSTYVGGNGGNGGGMSVVSNILLPARTYEISLGPGGRPPYVQRGGDTTFGDLCIGIGGGGAAGGSKGVPGHYAGYDGEDGGYDFNDPSLTQRGGGGGGGGSTWVVFSPSYSITTCKGGTGGTPGGGAGGGNFGTMQWPAIRSPISGQNHYASGGGGAGTVASSEGAYGGSGIAILRRHI